MTDKKDRIEENNKMEIKEEDREEITMKKEINHKITKIREIEEEDKEDIIMITKTIKIKVIEEVDREDIIMIIEEIEIKTDKKEPTNLKMRKMIKEEEVIERSKEVEIETIKEVTIKTESHTIRERKRHTTRTDRPMISPNNHNKERLTQTEDLFSTKMISQPLSEFEDLKK